MPKRKKESMSSVLEEAHRRKHIASVGGDEDALPIYDNSNYHKEINRLLDNLYCLATGKKPDKSERKFEIIFEMKDTMKLHLSKNLIFSNIFAQYCMI